MIQLPKDADGREIPLDTKVLYGSGGREMKMNLLLNLANAMGEDPRDIVRPKALASQETK